MFQNPPFMVHWHPPFMFHHANTTSCEAGFELCDWWYPVLCLSLTWLDIPLNSVKITWKFHRFCKNMLQTKAADAALIFWLDLSIFHWSLSKSKVSEQISMFQMTKSRWCFTGNMGLNPTERVFNSKHEDLSSTVLKQLKSGDSPTCTGLAHGQWL